MFFGIADYASFVVAVIVFLMIPGPGNLALITSTGKGGIRDTLITKQDKGNDPKRPGQGGSWGPDGTGFDKEGGRIMSTSLSLLTLEVYFRHLPLYRRDMGVVKEAK